jgi:hypothetical protein
VEHGAAVIGTVVVNGSTYSIVKLTLRDSMLIITAHGPLPPEPAVQSPATVFGEDGKGFAQAWPCDIPGMKEVPEDCVTIELPMRMESLVNE